MSVLYPCIIGERSRVHEEQRWADLAQLGVQRALGTEQALQLVRRPAKLARYEDARPGGLGGLRDRHLCVDGYQADCGDDDVRAGECGGEGRYVGILGRGDAHATRGEGPVLLFVVGGLLFAGVYGGDH